MNSSVSCEHSPLIVLQVKIYIYRDWKQVNKCVYALYIDNLSSGSIPLYVLILVSVVTNWWQMAEFVKKASILQLVNLNDTGTWYLYQYRNMNLEKFKFADLFLCHIANSGFGGFFDI